MELATVVMKLHAAITMAEYNAAKRSAALLSDSDAWSAIDVLMATRERLASKGVPGAMRANWRSTAQAA